MHSKLKCHLSEADVDTHFEVSRAKITLFKQTVEEEMAKL